MTRPARSRPARSGAVPAGAGSHRPRPGSGPAGPGRADLGRRARRCPARRTAAALVRRARSWPRSPRWRRGWRPALVPAPWPAARRVRPRAWRAGLRTPSSQAGESWAGRSWAGRLRAWMPGPGAEALARLCRAGNGIPGLDRALRRWSARLGAVPAEGGLLSWQRAGIRLLCPGDPGWPGMLDVLGDAQPWALWVRGTADLRFPACARCPWWGPGCYPLRGACRRGAGGGPGRARLVRGVRRCARHRWPCAPGRARRRRHHFAVLPRGSSASARAPRSVRGHRRRRPAGERVAAGPDPYQAGVPGP